MTAQYIVYADGACSGNPGPGGWAFEVTHVGFTELAAASGMSTGTTNNIMELTAATNALEAILKNANMASAIQPGEIILRLDSQYVLDGLFKWIEGWKANGWKTAGRKPVKNPELWQRLDRVRLGLEGAGFELKAEWVKGHNGEPGNERVDTEAARNRDLAIDALAQKALEPSGAAPVSGPEGTFNPVASSDPVGAAAQGTSVEDSIKMMRQIQGRDGDAEQIELLEAILDRYTKGYTTPLGVLAELKDNASALGLR